MKKTGEVVPLYNALQVPWSKICGHSLPKKHWHCFRESMVDFWKGPDIRISRFVLCVTFYKIADNTDHSTLWLNFSVFVFHFFCLSVYFFTVFFDKFLDILYARGLDAEIFKICIYLFFILGL